ncbi:MAG: hypothetical protein QOH95_1531 [Gaiellaceae bacterium]|nr:hypothetical protein [Gaiellaceae bacterium]
MRLLLLGAVVLISAAPSPALRDAHACPGAPGFTCSTLDVPLDHSHRVPGTLHLAVGAADNVSAPRGVLLVITGGPGQPGVPSLARVPLIVGAELHDYRVVVYDQRGTGAGALDCPDLQAAMGSSDLFPPPPSAVRSCAAKLGARRQFFGTDDVVADMESLRLALGAKKWTLDGISYGTYVGERYALAHPEHVSKLVLDSVVPHVGLTDLGVVEFQAVRRVLRDVCGDDSCANDLAAVVKAHHIGPVMLDALTFDSIVDPTYMSTFNIPTILRDARQGKLAELVSFLQTVHQEAAASPGFLDQGLHASALCADWRYPWGTSAAPVATRRAKLQRAVAPEAERPVPVRSSDRARERVHRAVPAVVADATVAPRHRQAARPDAARERRPRPVDAARVGPAGAEARAAGQAGRRPRSGALRAVARRRQRGPSGGCEVPARSVRCP